MKFNLIQAIEILERTPLVLETLLKGLSDEWVLTNEGGDTWSPYDVIGHLIYAEKTDWCERMEVILSESKDKTFGAFDRFAQFEESKGKTIIALLEEFKTIRKSNLLLLKSKNLTEKDLAKTGIHPSLGEVTLEQLLATWAVHDLNHLAQISRVMSKQYKEEVGPWIAYLGILK